LFFDTTLTPEERANKLSQNADFVAAKFFVSDAEKVAFKQASSLFARTIGNQQNAIARAFNVDADTFATAQSQVQQAEDRFLGVWGALLASADAESPQILDQRNRTAFYADPANYKYFVDNVIVPTLTVFGDEFPDFGPTLSTAEVVQVVDEFFTNPDYADTLENIRRSYEVMFPSLLFPDEYLRTSLVEGIRGFERVDDADNRVLFFGTTGIPRDWFSGLDESVKSSVLSLVGGTYGTTTERESAGFLGSLGSAFGIGAGALIGGAISGGNPAAISAGASAGAQLGG